MVSACFRQGEAVTIETAGPVREPQVSGSVRLGALTSLLWGDLMASQKSRPAHVPEENVYEKMHWMVIVTYLAAIGAITLLINNAG